MQISQNHFHTFKSSDFPHPVTGVITEAPSTTAIHWKQANEGLFGQVIAGAKLDWSESDIAYHGFMTMPGIVPEPSEYALFSIGLLLLLVCSRSRRRKDMAQE
ncbi:MAG: PEP-CTERM sorting domain-containing protein [Lentisphaeraceae bacterium]|nr:PEP-CTERM sorting domain-containing protein [Lentisphaeraceae bacterium]